MDKIITIAGLVGAISTIGGVLIACVAWILKINNAIKCMLRSDMLNIYYNYKEDKVVPQHQYENFGYLYQAYKALHGNSFIEKVNDDFRSWEVER